MTTLERSAPPRQRQGIEPIPPSQRLRTSFAAVRVGFTWLGVRKTLSAEQKAVAAESFGAQGQYLSAAKKLLDTRHPAFCAVGSLRSQILCFWKGRSLPYPEPAVRLIRQDEIERFNVKLLEFRQELHTAVQELDHCFDELKATAREQLGSLYHPGDYPPSLVGLFAVDWDFPSVEPPQYLARLNPDLYEQERQRISARFDQAVQLAEQAFIAEFSGLVSHLTERLTAGVDGQKKVFRDSALTNLGEFFARFRSLNVSSNEELDQLVGTAQAVLAGTQPAAVRESAGLRQQISSQLAAVQAALEGLLVDQPRRKILRNTSATQTAVNP